MIWAIKNSKQNGRGSKETYHMMGQPISDDSPVITHGQWRQPAADEVLWDERRFTTEADRKGAANVRPLQW